ncbi:methyltransferase domain-containing protein [Candidatus Woesearchaeota archaeon]|nr:methyltransferase domain-containing protein [Candidatus Woesearchaeota archaeon]
MSYVDIAPDISSLGLLDLTKIKHTDRITYWPPTRAEIKFLAYVIGHLGTDARVLDVGCGNAFVSHLLASENICVVGFDKDRVAVKKTPYRHPNLELSVGDAFVDEDINRFLGIDVVFNSWMDKGIDMTEMIHRLQPKAIIYIREGYGYTGINGKSYELNEQYKPFIRWRGLTTHEVELYAELIRDAIYRGHRVSVETAAEDPRWENSFRHGFEQKPRLFGPDGNIVEIQLRSDVEGPKIPAIIKNLEKYPWEADLESVVRNTRRFEGTNDRFGPLIEMV